MLTSRALNRTLAVLLLGCVFAIGREASARASCSEPVNGHLGWTLSNPITSPMFWPTPRSDAASYVLHWATLVTYTDPIFGTDSNGNFQGLGWWDEGTDSWSFGSERELADMCA